MNLWDKIRQEFDFEEYKCTDCWLHGTQKILIYKDLEPFLFEVCSYCGYIVN